MIAFHAGVNLEIRRWGVEEWRASAKEWDSLLASGTADPVFMSCSWQSTWWSLYGTDKRELCLLAAYSSGMLVGLAPFYLERTGSHGAQWVSACLLGGARVFGGSAGMMTEYVDVIASPEWAPPVRAAVLAELFGELGVHECRIVLASEPKAWEEAANAHRAIVPSFRRANPVVSYQADLGPGFEKYLMQIPATTRRALWHRRSLLRSLGETVYVEVPEDDIDPTLDLLNQMHAIRWGQHVFDEYGLRFHSRLSRAWAKDGSTHLTTVRVGGELVSVLYDVSVGDKRYNLQMGFNDKFDSRLSLGLLHLGYAMEDAANRGTKTYDFLAGSGRQVEYKSRLSQRNKNLCDLTASRAPILSRVAGFWALRRRLVTTALRPATPASLATEDWKRSCGVVENYLHSSATRPRLRVAVILDSWQLRRPFAQSLAQIAACNFADIKVVVQPSFAARSSIDSRRSWISRALSILKEPRRRRQAFYALYERIDLYAHSSFVSQMNPVDVRGLLEEAKLIVVDPLRTGRDVRLAAGDVALLREQNLDVVLRFGLGIIRGEILDVARYGVWSYHHGDSEFYRGGPPGFWELYERAPLTGAILQLLNETLDGGTVLARVQTGTRLGYSLIANRLPCYMTAQSLVIQKLRELHEFGWKSVIGRSCAPSPYRGSRPLYRAPINSETAKFLVGRGFDALRRRVPRWLGGKRTKPGEWRIGIRPKSSTAPWTGIWKSWRWITAPPGHYYADPMLFEWQGRSYLFVEDFDHAKSKGSLAVSELAADGTPLGFTVILARPYHLSFPNVFSRHGSVYLMPETRSAGRIELYRAIDFPNVWRRERTLLDYPGVETVLHCLDDGRELMMTGIADTPRAQVSMHLFVAKDLQSEWRLHPRSPVHCDVRYSRNAGPVIFVPGEGIVRVSQDGSLYYGRQMHFHRISKISAEDYGEEWIGTRNAVDIGHSAGGTHTYSASTKWEAIDALMV